MTALFFITQGALSRGLPPPGTAGRGAGAGRQIDFASLAQLFAEVDEPPTPRAAPRPIARLAMLALILLGLVGDLVFVAKPNAPSIAAGVAHSARAVDRSGSGLA